MAIFHPTAVFAGILIFATAIIMTACSDSSSSSAPLQGEQIIEAFITEQATQIGGATTSAARYTDAAGTDWSLYNMADRLAITPVGMTAGAVYEIRLPDYIRDILVVQSGETDYALLALGKAGIAVVNITTPSAMSLLHTVPVNYYQDNITFAEGGGDLVTGVIIQGNGYISALESDGTTLWIANESYGIHRTALANLISAVPLTEADGTLVIDDGDIDGNADEVFTLQYAGENPWGAPADLQLHNGHLYAAIGFLGLGIYNPDTLERVGYYNLYTDTSVQEDWFRGMNVTTEVQPGNIDPVTGMPDYNQASFEIKSVWHGTTVAPTPWADFDRYGKYYYKANALDVADFTVGTGSKTTVFMAYGLAGIVAVDVNTTNPAALTTAYSGYAPAVPAHGPDEPTGQQSQSLFPYFGVGMLKEAGVIDVEVDAANNRVFYSDHFAGLVILEGADNPTGNWQQTGAPFNNDTMPQEHWPDYEFVTSYDMGDYDPEDNESLPIWMYQAPSLLVTGEISGHGSAFVLMPTLNSAVGNVDVVQATGAGGLNFIDLEDLNALSLVDRFSVPAYFASTTEIGAAADRSPTVPMAIGHTQGVAATGRYLYLADGPHGMSVWNIADSQGNALDTPHVVANTLTDEYPIGDVYPTPHAYNTVISADRTSAFVLSQSLGLRRVDIRGPESGQGLPGNPLLLTPQPSDFYEHNLATGSFGGISRQDHAYDVALHGNYAVVADGSNGLTVYDLTADPSDGTGAHVVANLGSDTGNPGLGRASGVELWTDPQTGRIYALVASGHAGIGVVDMTELLVNGTKPGMTLVKLFEPIKTEVEPDGSIHIGKADSRSIDVDVNGDYAYFSYGGFGLLAYSLADLIAPLPAGTPPNKIWEMHGYDYRPVAVAQYQLQTEPGQGSSDPEALYMTPQYFPANKLLIDGNGRWFVLDQPKLLFYVAYGPAGVAKIDWSDPANPKLLQLQDTAGEATATAIAHGRVYVADGSGGLLIFR